MPYHPPEIDDLGALLILLIMFAIVVVPFVRIFQKAGRTGWWAVLMLIPLVNLIVLWIFAFSRWPALETSTGPHERR